jgi:uncharacterized protein involved in tellurium resistance
VIGDPAGAPPRPDITFLRRRSRPRPAAASPVADFIAGRGPHPNHTPPAAAPPPPPAASSSLDLAALPAAAAPSRPAASSSLDLSDRPAASAAAAVRAEPAAPPAPVIRGQRVRAGQQQLLSVTAPTVTLTRLQSGIGHLEIEAISSAQVGDLRLGAAYQLADGTSSTVQYTDGNRFAPSARRPVVVAGREEYEYLRLDLRQVGRLRRLAVYAFSESRRSLTWSGTLVVTTFGGARIELPLETLFAGPVAVLLSIYNVDGELVIRAEMETITGDVREAARAYGYDRITWRDDRHPVDG